LNFSEEIYVDLSEQFFLMQVKPWSISLALTVPEYWQPNYPLTTQMTEVNKKSKKKRLRTIRYDPINLIDKWIEGVLVTRYQIIRPDDHLSNFIKEECNKCRKWGKWTRTFWEWSQGLRLCSHFIFIPSETKNWDDGRSCISIC